MGLDYDKGRQQQHEDIEGKNFQTATNPNPRANENVIQKEIAPDENKINKANSEVTDGEDG